MLRALLINCIAYHRSDIFFPYNKPALSAFSDPKAAMGLSLSGDATLVGRLEAQETITNAISDWASAVGKFADVGKQLPGTMSELAGIGKGLPRK